MFTGKVQVPFWFFERERLAIDLDLFDGDAVVWRIAVGEEPLAAARPHDPLTAWVALAYIGGIELGGPVLDPGLDRQQRLALARTVLSEEELLVVETIAVPERYRRLHARVLERMVRTASDYRDRLWAGCWLILVGWTRSSQCTFEETSLRFPLGELEHTIIEAYAHSKGVRGREDRVGWKRVSADYESNLVLHRLAICEIHYQLNGPPPYDCMCKTIPPGEGWRTVVRVVPEHAR